MIDTPRAPEEKFNFGRAGTTLDLTMNQDISLHFEVRLRNISMIAVAVNLWETPKIKNEIEKFRREIQHKDVASAYNDGRTWRVICGIALDQVGSLNLPSELICDLKKMVVFIGDKIFLWVVYVFRELLFHAKYSQKIYWTVNGLVNENKIYCIWRNDPSFPGMDNYYRNKIALFSIAATHADVKFIRQNLKEIAKVVTVYTGIKIQDINKFKVNSAMTILLINYFVVKSHTLKFDLLYSTLKSKEYPKGTDMMFFYCAIYGGLEKAAEYFYKKLKESDKEKLVFQSAVECVTDASNKINFNHEKSRLPVALIYLLGKMTSKQKREFFSRKISDVLTIFLYTWPFQQLCIPILDYFWNDLPLPSQVSVSDRTFELLKKLSENRHEVYKSVLQPVMKNVLARFPGDLKMDSKRVLQKNVFV